MDGARRLRAPSLIAFFAMVFVSLAGCFGPLDRPFVGDWVRNVESDGVGGLMFTAGTDFVALGWRHEAEGVPPTKITVLNASDGGIRWQGPANVEFPLTFASRADPERLFLAGERGQPTFGLYSARTGTPFREGSAHAVHEGDDGSLRLYDLHRADTSSGTKFSLRGRDGDEQVLWNTSLPFRHLATRFDSMVLSPDGTRLFVVEQTFEFWFSVWDTADGRELWNASLPNAEGWQYMQNPLVITFGEHGRRIVFAGVESCNRCGPQGQHVKRPVLVSYDVADGRLAWEKRPEGMEGWEPRGVASRGAHHVFLFDAHLFTFCPLPNCNAPLVAIDDEDGTEQWRFQGTNGTLGTERILLVEHRRGGSDLVVASMGVPKQGGDDHRSYWRIRTLDLASGSVREDRTFWNNRTHPVLTGHAVQGPGVVYTALYTFDLPGMMVGDQGARKGWEIVPIKL